MKNAKPFQAKHGHLVIDNTYCDPAVSLPTQEHALQEVCVYVRACVYRRM